jgi:hypothetical protein
MKKPTKTEVLTVLSNFIAAEKRRANNNMGMDNGIKHTIACLRLALKIVRRSGGFGFNRALANVRRSTTS